MVLSEQQIQINFNVARAEAQKLEDIAAGMKQLAKRMESTIRELSAGWKGESAVAYLAKAEAVKDGIESTAESIYTAAARIRANAQKVYNAEMEALRIAEQRTAD